MDNLTLLQIAENCCPPLFKKFLGVASANNFLSDRDRVQMQQYLVMSRRSSLFYQIVNTSNQLEKGEHWLLISYIIFNIPTELRKRRVERDCRQNVLILAWDPLGQPIKRYRAINKRLRILSECAIEIFEICYPLQTPSSNLCGLYCVFMAHYLHQVGLANRIQRMHDNECLEKNELFHQICFDQITEFLRM